MKSLSLKMDESVFEETEKILRRVRKNRNRYINEAVRFYNLVQSRKLLASQLKKDSNLTKEDSLKVLAEFEKLGYED
jgi:metal-responsive CopG/Arc/MetJ family transcriptional regulator